MGLFWSDYEIGVLKENYPTSGSVGCNKLLSRKISAIRYKAYELGVATKCKNGKALSHQIVAVIERNRVIAVCPSHGRTEHRLRINRSPRCSLCRTEYTRTKGARLLSKLWSKKHLINSKWAYAHRLRVQMRNAVSNKNIGCFRFLPYSPDDLRNHLDAIRDYQNNNCPSCGDCYDDVGFHIDHIIPLASANGYKDILDLFVLKNLSLLCGSCNCSKGKRI